MQRVKLDAIFKAYDVRGVYPDEIDEEAAHRIGSAFARFTEAEAILVGRDMRESSVPLSQSFCAGLVEAGADAIDIGLVSTDQLYFSAGDKNLPGAMFTASHNPPEYNGIKLCRAGAGPVGEETGLAEIKAMAQARAAPAERRGATGTDDTLDAFVAHLLSLVDVEGMKPFRVVADAGNGMGGKVVPAVFEHLPCELTPMYFELDGTFPNHPADPIQLENLQDLRAKVREVDADIGLAFDGDADRVFLVDERAEPVSGSLTTALVAKRLLQREPGATIIHNAICSRTVPEVISEEGGKAVRSRVGHSFIKALMAETGAIFAGEHSGHYYFLENYRADSGLLAALVVLETMSVEGERLSELCEPLRRYAASGEINIRVGDQQAAIERVADAHPDAEQDRLDGLTVSYPDWWFNLRPSNTEPLLRLNIEAPTEEQVARKRDEILEVVEGSG